MRNILLVSALTVLAFTGPALAKKGDHHGRDRGDDSGYDYRGEDQGCPPGLAKKHNGCQPPGQARHGFYRGEYLPDGFSRYTAYSDIPLRYRSRIRYGDRYRYIYQDNRVYVVDPATRLIRDIVDLLR